MSAPGFEQHSHEVLFDGFLVRLAKVSVQVPDGSVVSREIVHHPGAVAIVAIADDQTVVFERQYRAALDRNILEIPAGKRDVAGEPAAVTARRELIEETGFDAEEWVELGSFHNSPGFTDEHTTMFLATGLTEVGANLQGPEEEAMELVRVPLVDVWGLIDSGELVDAKSIIGIAWALHHLGSS